MVCALCSFLHFFVDGLCAYAMLGWLASAQPLSFLVYNFCAFALQLPFGALLDLRANREGSPGSRSPLFATVLGVLLTFVGMFTASAVLGIGNALFHVGGGVLTINEDKVKNLRGQALGVFVAPGALGLYLGSQASSMAEGALCNAVLVGTAVLMAVLLGALIAVVLRSYKVQAKRKRASSTLEINAQSAGRSQDSMSFSAVLAVEAVIVFSCFAVVVLRSYVGMGVTFAWKTGFMLGLAATIMVVGGKMLGGICAAHLGRFRTVAVSLALSAVFYLLSTNIAAGLAALMFFNMTMPITLYLLVERYQGFPGTCFGLLTLGLFLGYLPVFWGYLIPLEAHLVGACGCVISLVLLALAVLLAAREPDVREPDVRSMDSRLSAACGSPEEQLRC